MGIATKTLYDTDFVEWAAHTAALVRKRAFDEIEIEGLAEEIEDLGKSEQVAVWSRLRRMLMHLIKMRIQPELAGASWRASIVDARAEIGERIEISPSLRRHLEDRLQEIYRRAVRGALDETGLARGATALAIPEVCPYTLAKLLEGDLDSLLPPG